MRADVRRVGQYENDNLNWLKRMNAQATTTTITKRWIRGVKASINVWNGRRFMCLRKSIGSEKWAPHLYTNERHFSSFFNDLLRHPFGQPMILTMRSNRWQNKTDATTERMCQKKKHGNTRTRGTMKNESKKKKNSERWRQRHELQCENEQEKQHQQIRLVYFVVSRFLFLHHLKMTHNQWN